MGSDHHIARAANLGQGHAGQGTRLQFLRGATLEFFRCRRGTEIPAGRYLPSATTRVIGDNGERLSFRICPDLDGPTIFGAVGINVTDNKAPFSMRAAQELGCVSARQAASRLRK